MIRARVRAKQYIQKQYKKKKKSNPKIEVKMEEEVPTEIVGMHFNIPGIFKDNFELRSSIQATIDDLKEQQRRIKEAIIVLQDRYNQLLMTETEMSMN